MSCEFCIVSSLSGPKHRKRPREAVLEELAMIPQRNVFFADPNLLGHTEQDAAEFVGLCEEMIRRRVRKRWICQASLHFADREEVMQAASRAGCMAVQMGVESPSPEVVKGNMRKHHNLRHLARRDFAHRLHRHGIAVVGSFILGNDEDTPETGRQIVAFVDQTGIDVPTLTFLTPLPGTRLWRRLQAEGRLGPQESVHDWSSFSVAAGAVLDSKRQTRSEIERQGREVVLTAFSRRRILHRAVRAFCYTGGSLITTLAVLRANVAYKSRHVRSAYFRRLDASRTAGQARPLVAG